MAIISGGVKGRNPMPSRLHEAWLQQQRKATQCFCADGKKSPSSEGLSDCGEEMGGWCRDWQREAGWSLEKHTAAGGGDVRRGAKAAEAVSEAAQMSRNVHLSKVP